MTSQSPKLGYSGTVTTFFIIIASKLTLCPRHPLRVLLRFADRIQEVRQARMGFVIPGRGIFCKVGREAVALENLVRHA
jgi:hypothetical protein